MAALAAVALAGSATCTPAPTPRTPAAAAPAPAASPTPEPSPLAALEPLPAAEPDAPLDFVRDVRPVLVQHCDPCHSPGGRMYERLPFDDPATVASHPEGILRRLKGDGRATVERWIAAYSGAR
jgi:hypothetical protein